MNMIKDPPTNRDARTPGPRLVPPLCHARMLLPLLLCHSESVTAILAKSTLFQVIELHHSVTPLYRACCRHHLHRARRVKARLPWGTTAFGASVDKAKRGF
jgi:hypothetical protein